MRISTLLFCLFLLTKGFAYQSTFETLSRENGLPHSTVNTIVQDHDGYMWFGTQDGLVRYDGYEYKVFRASKTDPHAIIDDNVSSIFVDSKNRLWIRFDAGGVSVYDSDLGYFLNLFHDPNDSTTLSSVMVTDNSTLQNRHTFCEDAEGNIWMASNNGLNRIDQNYRVKRYLKKSGLKTNEITALYYDLQTNLVFVGTTQGLSVIHPKTEKITNTGLQSTESFITLIRKDQTNTYWMGTKNHGLYRFRLSHDLKMVGEKRFLATDQGIQEEKPLRIHDICIARDGRIWAGGDTGLHLLDQQGEVIKNYTGHFSEPHITSVKEDERGEIWASSTAMSRGLFHVTDHKVEEYNHKDARRHGFGTNYILSMTFDKEGILWMGSSKGGVIKKNPYLPAFGSLKKSVLEADRKSDTEVYSIYKNKDQLFVGTNSHLFVLNEDFEVEHTYKIGTTDKDLSANIIGVLKPFKQQLWVGYFAGKLSLLDPELQSFTHFAEHLPEDPTKFKGWSLRDICTDKNGTSYFATMYGGLIYQRKGENTFGNVEDLLKGQSVNFKGIMSLKCMVDGQILIGTNTGLFVYDPEQINLKHLTKEKNGLSHNEIRCIHQSKHGDIFLGTRFGLTHLNTSFEVINTYDYDNGLPSNTIHGILEDEQGQLWMSTNNGISCFNQEQKTFTNFTTEDGISSHEYNECAFFQDQEGVMYFGGSSGLTYFHPAQIHVDSEAKKVNFTALKLNQKLILPQNKTEEEAFLTDKIENTHRLNIPLNQNNIRLSLSTLDYRFPSKIFYRYQMKGFDKEWKYLRAGEHQIHYSWLNAGDYELLVQSSTDGKQWSESRNLAIEVIAPFYQRWWFLLIIALALISVVAWSIRNRIQREKEQKVLLNQQVEEAVQELREQQSLLEEKYKKEEGERWLQKELGKMNKILNLNKASIEKLSQQIISHLAPCIEAPLAVVHLKRQQQLHVAAQYGCSLEISRTYDIGEGIIGSTFKDQQAKFFEQLPPQYFQPVSSGLGQLTDCFLYLFPIKYEEITVGVLEIGMLKPLDPLHQSMIERMLEAMAIRLNAMETQEQLSSRVAEEKMHQAEREKFMVEEDN